MRYWRPWRRFLIWVSFRVPECLDERIVEYLYPDNAMISFKGR